MAAVWQFLLHDHRGLWLAYALVEGSMLIGLVRVRAFLPHFLVSPLLALLVMLVTGLGIQFVTGLLPGHDTAVIGVLRVLLTLVLFPWLGYRVGAAAGRSASTPLAQHRRGTVVSSAPTKAARRRGTGVITLAGVPLAPQDETKHFKLIGTTGTGKSTAIREILSGALARGDRVIIADPDGGYLARFHDAARGDVILNPFDGDALKWDLFGEITNDYDVEQLARSLIPDNGASDRTWTEYARTFLAVVTQQALVAGVRDDAELYRLVTSASLEELRVLLAGTAASPFLEPGNERMFGSVRSIASSAVRALKYTTRQQAAPFSVRQWVRHGAARCAGGQGGVLFLPYKAGEIAALRSLISAWIRIGIFEAMDRDEGDQHLWFIIDELDALGEIDGLKDALARLRKFGGRCVLGFQSIAQVSGTYGRAVAETIVENCGNTLILRCSASEHGGTAEFASKLIGQREVIHTVLSQTTQPDQWRSSKTTSQNLRIEPAIMASQIERLPDLEGFLKMASVPDWQRVQLTTLRGPQPVRVRKPAIVTSPSTPAPRPPSAAAPGIPVTKAGRPRKAKVSAVRSPEPPSNVSHAPAAAPDIAPLAQVSAPTANPSAAAE